MTHDYSDRRKYERVALEEPLQVSVRQDEQFSGWFLAHILDIGLGGLRFSSDLHIPLSSNIQFRMDHLEQPFLFSGQVIWKDQQLDTPIYGLHFPTKDKHERITETLISQLPQIR